MYNVNLLLENVFKYNHPIPLTSACLSPDMEDASDETLLQFIKTGSPRRSRQAFSILYNRYYLAVWKFIKNRVYDPEHAQDIFLDVWEIAISGLSKFEWRNKTIKSWLMTTTHYKILDHIRQQKKDEKIFSSEAPTVSNGKGNCDSNLNGQILHFITQTLQLDASQPNPLSLIIQEEADKQVQVALTHLKPETRQIIILIYYKQKNSTEIGQILNLKPATIRKKHERALKQLYKLLGNKDN